MSDADAGRAASGSPGRRPSSGRDVFVGRIAGVGSTSGVRLVIGRWDVSPFGSFADVMVERADGHRVLLAPDDRVAEFVSQTYQFDETRIGRVEVCGDDAWAVDGPDLTLNFSVGRRTALGAGLALVPRRVATSTVWADLVDPIARRVLRGVRTRGTAGNGRREWYGATGMREIVHAAGEFEGADLGSLARVDPPCRFGFSSTPARPSVTEVTTTVRW